MRIRQAGDTLIEVLFAVSVFSLVIVGSLAIMNQGTAAAERSLETTLVRQQIDGQAEALRFMHDSYVAVYQKDITFDLNDRDPVTNKLLTSPAEEWYKLRQFIREANVENDDYDNTSCPTTRLPGSFAIDTENVHFITNIEPTETFSMMVNDGDNATAEGLWVRAIVSGDTGGTNQSNAGYIDFHIRACWSTAGSLLPATIGTIVRLYEPRG